MNWAHRHQSTTFTIGKLTAEIRKLAFVSMKERQKDCIAMVYTLDNRTKEEKGNMEPIATAPENARNDNNKECT